MIVIRGLPIPAFCCRHRDSKRPRNSSRIDIPNEQCLPSRIAPFHDLISIRNRPRNDPRRPRLPILHRAGIDHRLDDWTCATDVGERFPCQNSHRHIIFCADDEDLLSSLKANWIVRSDGLPGLAELGCARCQSAETVSPRSGFGAGDKFGGGAFVGR